MLYLWWQFYHKGYRSGLMKRHRGWSLRQSQMWNLDVNSKGSEASFQELRMDTRQILSYTTVPNICFPDTVVFIRNGMLLLRGNFFPRHTHAILYLLLFFLKLSSEQWIKTVCRIQSKKKKKSYLRKFYLNSPSKAGLLLLLFIFGHFASHWDMFLVEKLKPLN